MQFPKYLRCLKMINRLSPEEWRVSIQIIFATTGKYAVVIFAARNKFSLGAKTIFKTLEICENRPANSRVHT